MSQDGDAAPAYLFVTADGEEKSTSRDYNGKATATYHDGEIYEGYFKEGIREGRGVYRYLNGDVYDGEWLKNKKHGMGTLTYIGVGEYKGFWENGRRHGEGVFTYSTNGDSYSGWWRFGRKEGFGTYTFAATGQKMVGDWENGEIKSGKWIYPNGMYYEGPFANNKPNGEGKWVFPYNNNTCKGRHTQKELEPPEDAPEPEEGEVVKKDYAITWTSDLSIASSSAGINAIER